MLEHFLNLIENPPEEAKGCTRWWWYGCAVTREGIKKQLEYMKAANIGSVEIQVIYPLHEDDDTLGIKNIQYFSPEFFSLLEFAVRTAEEMHMKVDYTLGSSWPFGGPFVTHEMSAQQAQLYQIDLYGPCTFDYDFTSRITGRIIKVVMGRMEKGKMLEDSIIDLTDRLGKRYLYGWEYGDYLENIDIPAGSWKVNVLYIQKYRQLVGIPAPNMSGYVIDHCNKAVTDYFLENAGTPIVKKIGPTGIRSFFCDSIEVEGHNWTEEFLEKFKERRGYDLSPYIYALWGDIGDISQEIRHDYYKTMSELTLENFFFSFAAWCRQNGSTSRIQAHGTWGDILKAYSAADIPEGETFGPGDRLEVNTVHRKLASSAGHIYGKNIISNESFTWLRMPRYMETLEQMKAAADAIFLDGMNMIVNHGYAYTPEAIEAPGWAFYASSHICHLNTWWTYYKELGKYIQTVCAILRQGRSVAQVAVYLPQTDVWSENIIGDLHLAMKLEEHIGQDIVNYLSMNGYYFDYINDEALTVLGSMHGGGLEINGNIYKVIILPHVHRIPLDTALKIKEFTEQGGLAAAISCIPELGCGFSSREKTGNMVKQLMREVFSGEEDKWSEAGNGKSVIVSDGTSALIKCLNQVFLPDLFIENNNGSMGYVHRTHENTDIYFISNISSNGCIAGLNFKTNRKGIIVRDPLSNKAVIPEEIIFFDKTGITKVGISFGPFQSLIFLLSDDITENECVKSNKPAEIFRELDISDSWNFTVPSLNYSIQMDIAHTWEKINGLKYYTGQGIYVKQVEIKKEMLLSNEILLCFEQIGEAAEIWIDGKCAGVLWKAPRELDIKSYLREGKNNIMVKVVNLWINDAINPDKAEKSEPQVISGSWPYFTETVNQIRQKRLYNWRERELVKEPLPSGIGGRVSLKYQLIL